MYSIQNRQKRTWTVPPVHAVIAGAPEQHKPVAINPGDSALVKAEHWDSVKKGNKVIEALLTGRHLVVTMPGKERAIEAEELKNPAAPLSPEELTEKDARVQLESKTELKEITLKTEDDAPREGRGPGRPSKE